MQNATDHPATDRMKIAGFLIMCLCSLFAWQCRDGGEPVSAVGTISSDDDLYAHIMFDQSYQAYSLFPNADSVVSGTLNGSSAHRPLVRVSLNETALSVLRSGRLPAGSTFPDGSVIVKEIREGGQLSLVAVMYHDRQNSAAGQGWLWAEYKPDKTVLVSIQNRGAGCVSCHAREKGVEHDLVRTFERQRP